MWCEFNQHPVSNVHPNGWWNPTPTGRYNLVVIGGGSVETFIQDIGDTDQGEKTVVFVGVLAGQVLPIAVTRVNSTLTTATNIAALW